jgi:transposase InsO family protein
MSREIHVRFRESVAVRSRGATRPVAESFFATIKGELIDHENYATKEAAINAIGDFIDGFYNTSRRHSAIDYVSPIEFELQFMAKEINGMAA